MNAVAREALLARQQRWASRARAVSITLFATTVAVLLIGTFSTDNLIWPALLGALAGCVVGRRLRTNLNRF